jgi:small subunit ribosomal protein S8
MLDLITDMLNKIRNSQAVFKDMVSVPFSNINYGIAKILEENKFVGKVDKKGKKDKREIDIELKYEQDIESRQKKIPVITTIKRISKPGKRIYRGYDEIKMSGGSKGIIIVSTPKGLMIAKEAKKKKLGGEVIVEIW